MSYASPLRWPSDVARHKGVREAGTFKIGVQAALYDIEGELRRFGATNIAITSDAPVGRLGKPASDTLAVTLREPGVSIFLRRRDRDLVFALDRYSRPIANLRALTLAIEGIRTIERYGGAGMEDRALAGFAALPAQAGTTVTHWSVALGLVQPYEGLRGLLAKDPQTRRALLADAELAYKDLARAHHSDVAGGSHEAMVELNRARDEARKELAP